MTSAEARSRPMRIVAWIAEPRVQRVCMFLAYLASFAAGLALMLTSPPIVANVLGATVAIIWPMFLMLGGVIGAASVLPGWNAFERIAITSLLTSIALFFVFVVGLPISYSTGQLVFYLFAFAAAAILVSRMWEIRFYNTEPRVR